MDLIANKVKHQKFSDDSIAGVGDMHEEKMVEEVKTIKKLNRFSKGLEIKDGVLTTN